MSEPMLDAAGRRRSPATLASCVAIVGGVQGRALRDGWRSRRRCPAQP
jgi:hypothetical protein